ncbi:glycosyltransferase family 4 protein [Methylobacter sp. S3L5C]|uniref:glycosyltransferase family 4 protein n=1 Tax=Methylobacter sp. S3L5C TaxID=2839024 RepID=UPI001FADF6F9|nr:glycosyltransferase family 4 protein [Methylobacter sp. S3L5C]UOA09127.1 glycosyltransferase family 4 protein [Methylobacter sp. S3L5C]
MTHRIAYLVSQYPAYSHTFILREVQQLRQLGVTIVVASINLPDRPLDKLTNVERSEAEQTFYIKSKGILKAALALGKTLALNPIGLLRGLKHIIKLGGWDVKRLVYHVFYLTEALLVGQWMRSQNITHLHVHFATPAASVGMLVKTVFGYSFSFTVHGPDEFYDAAGYNLPEKILAADFIFCISHYARSQVMKLSPVEAWSKLDVCRLGVDPQRFIPAPKNNQTESCNLLCVGRLTQAKGQAILLESLAQLQSQGISVTLTLVGMGPDEKSLRQYAQRLGISQQVKFTGAVDQDHILEYYKATDIFVLPSFAEGLPVVLMEAMAMEIPCITTAITGIPELILNGQEGLLVAASDSDGLTQAIKQLVGDQVLRQQLGKAGRERVLSDYDLYKNAQHLFKKLDQRIDALSVAE